MKIPADFTNGIGIDIVSEQYLAKIKRRQPQGPYYLGVCSAGDVLAYQVA
jgi:thioesterase domain-containing protein